MRPGRLVLTLTTIIPAIRSSGDLQDSAEQVWTSRVIPKTARDSRGMVSGESRNQQKRGGRSGQCLCPCGADSATRTLRGSLPHITQFANCRRPAPGSRPILGCAAFPLRTLAHSSLRAAGHPRARKPRYRHHELRVERFPRPFSENDTGFEIPQMRVVDSTPSDRILRLQWVAELSTSSLGAARP